MTPQSNDNISNITQICTYIVSGSVALGDILDLLDKHAASLGIFIAFLTYLTNLFFKILQYNRKK